MEKHLPPHPPGDERLYNVMIASMIIGIIIISAGTLYFRTSLYTRTEFFSELFFPEPVSLPNRVKMNNDYGYTFSVKNNEANSKEFKIVSGLELYTLYEYLEAKFRCQSKYSSSIFLYWSNGTIMYDLPTPQRSYEVIEPLKVEPGFNPLINWSTYTLELGFGPPLGNGHIIIFFANQTTIKYYISIDEKNKTAKFNDVLIAEDVDLKEGNNKISVKVKEEEIEIQINRKTFRTKFNNLHNGAFGFYTQDAVFIIQNFQVYKDSPVVIPDSGTILRYKIEDARLWQEYSKVSRIRSVSIPLRRLFREYNESINCEREPFYCQYFDLPNDVSFYIDSINLTRVIERIPVGENNINFVYTPPSKENAAINWTDFSIRFQHMRIRPGSPGAIIVKFSDKWAVMITRNNSYYLYPEGEKTRIDEIRNPEKQNLTYEEVQIKINPFRILLTINNQTVFSRQTPLNYTEGYLEVYVKNEFVSINPLLAVNNDPICTDPYSFVFCEMILQTQAVSQPRRIIQQQNYKLDVVTHDKGERVFNLFGFQPPNETSEIPEFEDIGNETEIIHLEAEKKTPILNLPIVNPYIQDRRIILNQPNARIVNATNFSVEYAYYPLDGAFVYEIGLLDEHENEQISIYVLAGRNEIIIYNQGEITNISLPINKSAYSSLKLEVKDGFAQFYVDRNMIHRIKTDINSGYFFAGSRNTYLEIDSIYFEIDGRKSSVKIYEDPCELKLIYRESHAKNITLAPGAKINITQVFRINREFDYGKVFVELYGSGGMNATDPLEIHFWLVRDDT